MGNADAICRAASILDRSQRTTPRALGLVCRFLPDLQRDTDHIMALLLEQSSCDGAIDAARHGDYYGLRG